MLLFGLDPRAGLVRPGAPRRGAEPRADEPAGRQAGRALPARRDPVAERRGARTSPSATAIVDQPVAAVYPLRRRSTSDVVGYSSILVRHRGHRVRVQRLARLAQPAAQSIAELISPEAVGRHRAAHLERRRSSRWPRAPSRAATARSSPSTRATARCSRCTRTRPTTPPRSRRRSTAPSSARRGRKYNTDDATDFPPLGVGRDPGDLPAGLDVQGRDDGGDLPLLPRARQRRLPGARSASTSAPLGPSTLCNSGLSPCGGTIAVMLPGVVRPRLRAGSASTLGAQTAHRPGGRSSATTPIPPLDLPGVRPVVLPAAELLREQHPGTRVLGDRPAERARDGAAGRARRRGDRQRRQGDGAAPACARSPTPQGNVVQRYTALRCGGTRSAAAQAAQHRAADAGRGARTARRRASASCQDDVAAKTGTAQTGDAQNHIDDWMIAFAPATDPVVAVARRAAVPGRSTTWGATVAGPVDEVRDRGRARDRRGAAARGHGDDVPEVSREARDDAAA